MSDFSQQQGQTGMTDLINATKGQALNTGALVQACQNQVTQTTNLVTAITNLTTSINNALSLGPWGTWSPTIGSGTGTITTVGTVVSRYAQAGKNVYFSLSITITTNGTGATSVTATLPVTAKAATAFSGRENTAGKMLQGVVAAGSSSMPIFNYDNTYPAANGYILLISGVYEAQ